MVDQYLITAKANFGYGKAAQKAGLPCALYRPVGTGDPIASGNPLQPINALFYSSPSLNFSTPNKYGHPQYIAVLDMGQVLVGDYIVDPNMGTFFVASLETFLPAYVVQCNRVITVGRPGFPPSGAAYYGGDETATETPQITRWPAAVTQGTKGALGDVKLPGDIRDAWVAILLPDTTRFGAQIRAGDVITDEQSITQRWIVSSSELTSLGYRLTAAQETT